MSHSPTNTIAAAIVVVLLLSGPARAVIIASSASDVCAPSTDPCIITGSVQIVSGSILDFGLRSVQVAPGGELDFAGGIGSVLCGSFAATTGTATAIRVRSSTGTGGTATIESRGACSANPLLPCVTDVECEAAAAGSCSLGDGTISLGGKVLGNAQTTASLTLRATGNVTIGERINMNGTVALAAGGNLTVSSSRGDVTLNGNIDCTGGGLNSGGIIDINVAGNLTVRGAVDLRGGELDGGIFDATVAGNISIENDILLDSKSGEGFGGDLLLAADGDLSVVGGTAINPLLLRANGSSGVDGFGGDGGEHSFTAGGTVSIGQFVKVITNGAIPDGTGGDISLTAPTISIAGRLESKGSGNQGGGGVVDLISGTGGITIATTASVDVGGGDGGGGDATLLSDSDITVSGRIDADGRAGGGAGSAFLAAAGAVTIDGTMATDGAISFGDTIAITACNITVGTGGLVDNKTTGGRNLLTASGFLTIEAGGSVKANAITGTNKFVYGNALFPPTVAGTVIPAAATAFDALLPNCASCSAAAQCDDGNPCSADSCDPVVGCVNVASTQHCDDANPCTDDSCDPASGCSNVANTLPCDDGDRCTTGDLCSAGQCVGQAPLDCNDSNACTDDSCDPLSGCSNVANPQQCNDGNLCTDDSCDPASGCSNVANTQPCDDGNQCTTGDVCSSGQCVGPSPLDCDDANPCTDDSCDSTAGCVNSPNALTCDDGNPCTTADACVAGQCSGEVPLDCNDGDPCTDDGCDPAVGCTNTPNDSPCDDGNACTTSDVCSSGQCTGSVPLVCEDGNVCTDDSCDPAVGCVNSPRTGLCNDGNPCTSDDICTDGQCVGQIPFACNDGNPCTDDACLADGTCINAPNVSACDDGRTCTINDVCIGGFCLGQPAEDCSDGNPCTLDTCDDTTGCLNLAVPEPTCFSAPVSLLQLSDGTKDTKDRLKWKGNRGSDFSSSDLGSPDTTTSYTLCIYDASQTGALVAARLDIGPGSSWFPVGAKGWRYKDKSGAASGVKKVVLRASATGRTKLQITAKGANVPMPEPFATDRIFEQDPAVSVQLINSEGSCWLVDYFDSEKNACSSFKARTK